jgi:hypothetical protein
MSDEGKEFLILLIFLFVGCSVFALAGVAIEKRQQQEYEVRDFVYTEYGVWHDVDDNSFGTFYFEGVEEMQVGDTIELLIPIKE